MKHFVPTARPTVCCLEEANPLSPPLKAVQSLKPVLMAKDPKRAFKQWSLNPLLF